MLPSQRLENQFWKNLGNIALRDYEIVSAYDKVLNVVRKLIVPEDEQRLIDLAFTQDLTQNQLDNFLQNWDIERYGAQKALLLAYVQKKWPQLDFGAYTGPRLKGLRAYYRFHNLDLIARYRQIVGNLNGQGIIPLIMKGGAMRYLRPELPRVMGDIDILITNEEQYKQAIKIVKSMEEYTPIDSGHSVDIYKARTEEGVLDIHHCIDDNLANYKEFNQAILSRAQLREVFGVQTLVPRPEDLVFILLFNLGKNLTGYSSISGIMYNVFDLAYLTSQPDFDWQIVRQNMEMTSIYWQIYLADTFVNKMVAGLLPNLLTGTDSENMAFELNKRYFYSRYIHEARYRRHELYLCKVILGKQSWSEYLCIKTKYQLLKHVWRSPILLKAFFKILPEFKKWNI